MSQQDIFADEWRACLREQYRYVVRQQDTRTLETLTVVMHEVGFSDNELAELRVLATMRADAMPDDFVPDMDILDPELAVHGALMPDMPEAEISVEMVESAEEEVESPPEETPEDDEDEPKQLSLF